MRAAALLRLCLQAGGPPRFNPPAASVLLALMLGTNHAEAQPGRSQPCQEVLTPESGSPRQTKTSPSKNSTDLATDELLRRAQSDIARGRLGRAARHYHDALRLQPRRIAALIGLAALRTRQGDTQEARRLLLKAARKRCGAPAHDVLAEMESAAGDRAAALLQRQAAVRKSPTATRLENLAQEYVLIRAYPAALSLWRQLRRVAPETPDADLQIAALALLSSELDPVLAGAETDNWIRRSLARLSLDGARLARP